jgi:tRNA modification GTPase
MDTIFATATAPVKSGVAIIRISGSKSMTCLKVLIGDALVVPRVAMLKKVMNFVNNEQIDEALVLWFPAPKSFTGEDIVELHIHGSRAVTKEILEILSKVEGVRMAAPGEFSKRAFDNGKMDLTEAEGLADLIDAETKAQARQAIRQKTGVLGDLYDGWRADLVSILANIEAYIDFPDEEIPYEVIKQVKQKVESLNKAISKHLDDNLCGQKLRSGIHAIIIGAPNSGKSSLLNNLAKRDIAIVSDIAGTTRDLIEVHLDLNEIPLTLIDSAGLRDTKEKIEEEGIRRTLSKVKDAEIKIALFDATELPHIDLKTYKLIDEDTLVVISKADLVKNVEISDSIKKYNPIVISVAKAQGIDKFISKLTDMASNHISITGDPIITRQRHRNHLTQAVGFLDKFDVNTELEISCENLRLAALEIGRITGYINIEEILDEIFSKFCIGK